MPLWRVTVGLCKKEKKFNLEDYTPGFILLQDWQV